ncbi:MAG: hypothetical protein IPN68_16720 [Bacteroidetes bacterium]|nr:hypothetical protein [Bacteroidota bacterium]
MGFDEIILHKAIVVRNPKCAMIKKPLSKILEKLWDEIDSDGISLKTVWGSMPMNSLLYINEIQAKLQEAIIIKNAVLVEELLIVISVDGYDASYTTLLCKLLEYNWHDRHEDIVMTLLEIKDPLSIDCIYKAALHIPAWDEGRSLAKKCIWALKAIGTSDAIDKIEKLANLDDVIIREVASMNLGR